MISTTEARIFEVTGSRLKISDPGTAPAGSLQLYPNIRPDQLVHRKTKQVFAMMTTV